MTGSDRPGWLLQAGAAAARRLAIEDDQAGVLAAVKVERERALAALRQQYPVAPERPLLWPDGGGAAALRRDEMLAELAAADRWRLRQMYRSTRAARDRQPRRSIDWDQLDAGLGVLRTVAAAARQPLPEARGRRADPCVTALAGLSAALRPHYIDHRAAASRLAAAITETGPAAAGTAAIARPAAFGRPRPAYARPA